MKCRADRKKQQFADSQKDDDGLGDLDHQDDPWLKVNQHTLQVSLDLLLVSFLFRCLMRSEKVANYLKQPMCSV